MKKITKNLLLIAFFIATNILFAQAPEGFNYQAAIRDASGEILENTNVNLRLTILTDAPSGTTEYQETQDLTTNEYGIVNHVVGSGTIETGIFSGITWGVNDKFLKVEVSVNGGPFNDMGTQQLVSVPYAIRAQSSSIAENAVNADNATVAETSEDNQWTVSGSNIFNNNSGKVGIGTNNPANLLVVEDLLGGATIRPTGTFVAHNCGAPCGQPETTQGINLQNENVTDGNAVGIGFSDYESELQPSAWIGSELTDKTNHYGTLKFNTRSTDGFNTRMTIIENGRIGIGNSNPQGVVDISMPSNSPGLSPRVRTNSGGFYIVTPNNDIRASIFDVSSGSNPYSGIYGDAKSGVPNIVMNNNRVGIMLSTINPDYTLHVNGSAGKPGGGSWSAASDKRLKENISLFKDGLSAILDINPVKYHYNEKSGIDTEKEYVGVIAQELKEVAPYMVGSFEKDGVEYLDVDNSAMTYMLINAVKEQQAQIKELQRQVLELSKTK